MILTSKDSGVCPLRDSWICFLVCMVEAPDESHSSGCQMQCFDKSMFVPYILQFCCAAYWMDLDLRLQHNVESENAWTVILISFAAGSLSNVILDQWRVSVLQYLKLYASLRSISACTCSCTDCIKSCVLGKLLIIAIRLKSSWFFVSRDEAHKQSLVNCLKIATLRESWILVWYSPNLAQRLSNNWL